MNGIQLRLGKISRLALFLMLLLFLGLLAGCSLIASPPALFPEYNERKLLGPGQYELIQWSPDGTELAYIDNKTTSLKIINIETGRKRTLVEQTSGGYYVWDPDGTITYMTYTPGNDPLVYDLHRIDTLTRQDDLLAADLPDVHNFHWLTSGKELLLVMGIAGDKSLVTNVYRMEFPSGNQKLLVSSEELGYEYFTRIAISPDNSTLAIVGYSGDPSRSSKLVTFDLVKRTILKEIYVVDIFPTQTLPYPHPNFLNTNNFDWVGSNRWLIDTIVTPEGRCYNYAIVFIDTINENQSYCVPSASGPIGKPILSPQLNQMAYIATVGPTENYIMISDPPIHFDLPVQR